MSIASTRPARIAIALMLGAALSLVASTFVTPSTAHAGPGSCLQFETFQVGGGDGPSSNQFDFEVPPGVTEITIVAIGAAGGDIVEADNSGGWGGAATATFTVEPGAELFVTVGVKGGDVLDVGEAAGAGLGGDLGGGDGGAGPDEQEETGYGGAGGGGASLVATDANPTQDDLLIIAGGGGGAGHGGDGGEGGGDEDSGAGEDAGDGTATGGGAGTAIAGGAPGSAGDDGTPGTVGGALQGGTGGTGDGTATPDGGGGGGGGYYGGGGGGGDLGTADGTGAGGGGGSSWVSAADEAPGSTAAFTPGTREGNGSVQISWDDPDCADLTIEKTAETTQPGIIRFTIEVENLGPDDATGVVVTDELPSQVDYQDDSCDGTFDDTTWTWTWAVGDLDDGATDTCTLTVLANDVGDFSNAAGVEGDQHDPDEDNNEDSADFSTGEWVDLALTVGVSPTQVNQGGTVTYQLVATNNRPIPATGVTVDLLFPPGVTYVSDTCGQGGGQPWIWAIGNLAVDQTVTCEVVVVAHGSGTQGALGAINGNESDPIPDNNVDDAFFAVLGPDPGATTSSTTPASPGDEDPPGELPDTGADLEEVFMFSVVSLLLGVAVFASGRALYLRRK